MTLSAHTNVIAAPQRGGDRAPQHPAGTMPAGRQQDVRGTINRRAEGATYSPTLPTSGAAALPPTTGVRRARELSPSLRSQNRPHAQLVEGYEYLRGARRHKPFGEFLGLDRMLENVVPQHGSIRACCSSYINPVELQPSIKLRSELKDASSHVLIPNINNIDFLQLKENRLKPFLRKLLSIMGWLVQTTSSYLLQLNRFSMSTISKISHERPINGCPLPRTLRSRASLRVSDHKCSNDSTYGANCSSPSRAYLTRINRQHQDVSRSEDQNSPRHRNRQVLPYTSPTALVPHPYHLNAQEHRPSLPAPCHHVQRSAA